MQWFRTYNEVVTDRKLRRIARLLGEFPESVIGIWITILAAANESTPRGSLNEYDHIDLAESLQMDPNRAKLFWQAFKTAGIISKNGVVNWSFRQFLSDSSKERTAKYRASKHAVTSQDRYGDGPDTDTDTDTE